MIEITDTAAAELKQLLEKEKKTDHGLRIFDAGMGCSGIQYGLTLDSSPKEEDAVSESNGIKLFFNKNIPMRQNAAQDAAVAGEMNVPRTWQRYQSPQNGVHDEADGD